MDTLHHKPIKKFNLKGNIYDDSAIIRLRLEYAKLITTEMRLLGYVPRIDINQDFTIQYNQQAKYFEFELTLYGVYVGKKKAQWITGIDETRVIFIQQSRLNEYSQEQV